MSPATLIISMSCSASLSFCHANSSPAADQHLLTAPVLLHIYLFNSSHHSPLSDYHAILGF